MTTTIEITEEYKAIIKYYVNCSETNKVNDVITEMIQQCTIDEEFGHLIYLETENGDYVYNSDMDERVLEVVENEVKKQLLTKYDAIASYENCY